MGLPTYKMRRYEIVAPLVTNAGLPSGYARELRAALLIAGFTGWTETDTRGYWRGRMEPGVTFLLFADDSLGDKLARIARSVMPDQEAIQIVAGEIVTLIEG